MRRRGVTDGRGLFAGLQRFGRRLLRPSAAPRRGAPVAPPRGRTGAAPPSRDIDLTGFTVEYAPDLDGDADPGEVVWTWVPYEEDPSQGKDRPVLVVGRLGHRLVGVPLTSRENPREAQVPVGTGPWDRAGRQSFAKVERLLEIDAHQVRREGAVLGRGRFDAVVAAVIGGSRGTAAR